MPPTVAKNRYNTWPLGFIAVPTPGTPVRITSLVDPTDTAAPETPTNLAPGSTQLPEYTFSAQQLVFEGTKPGVSHGTQQNTGNVYITLGGNRDDTGSIIHTLAPGDTWTYGSAAMNRNVFNLYEFYLDADNANDGAIVTALVQ